MGNAKVLKFGAAESAHDVLDQIVCDAARKMLQAAVGDEVNAFMKQHGFETRRRRSKDTRSHCPSSDTGVRGERFEAMYEPGNAKHGNSSIVTRMSYLSLMTLLLSIEST